MKKIILLSLTMFLLHTAQAQLDFRMKDQSQILDWIDNSIADGEFNREDRKLVLEKIKDVEEGPQDMNVIYNYGRALHKGLQKAFATQKDEYSEATEALAQEAGDAYRYATNHCECFGRANAMLGALYNSQKKYFITEPYLEVALGMEEGSEDWMFAANQYLLSGAYTYNTDNPKYLEVYKKFQKYAPSAKDDYYRKMAGLYVEYYQPNL